MALNFLPGNGDNTDGLKAEIADLKRVQQNALRIVFNAREQISTLLGVTLTDGGPTTDFGGFQLLGEDVLVTVDPFSETVAFTDLNGVIPSISFPAPNGQLAPTHQRMLLGLQASAERARKDKADPVNGALSLTGVAASDVVTLVTPAV